MTVLFSSNFDSVADGAMTGFATSAGAAFIVGTAASAAVPAISGTKIYYRNSDGDCSIYTALGAIGDQGLRHDQKITLAVTTSLKAIGGVLRNTLTQDGYRLVLEGNATGTAVILKIVKFNGGSSTLATSGDTVAPSASDVVHLEFLATGTTTTTLSARIWLNSDPRPSSPTLTVNNAAATVYQTGYPGVRKCGAFGNAGCDNLVFADGPVGLDFFDPLPQVSSDLAAAYAISEAINSSLAASYGITAQISADLTGSYAMVSADSVSNDLAAAYGINAAVSGDLAGTYFMLASVSKDLTAAYATASSGLFVTDQFMNNTETLWAPGQSVAWTWTVGGRPGSMTGKMIVDGTATLSGDYRLHLSGLPVGAGKLDAAVLGATPDLDALYAQYGTVA